MGHLSVSMIHFRTKGTTGHNLWQGVAIFFNFLQSNVSCCLYMYFLLRQHLPPDKSENDQDSDSLLFRACSYGKKLSRLARKHFD